MATVDDDVLPKREENAENSSEDTIDRMQFIEEIRNNSGSHEKLMRHRKRLSYQAEFTETLSVDRDQNKPNVLADDKSAGKVLPPPPQVSDKDDITEARKKWKDMSILEYLYLELTRGYHLEHDGEKFTEKRKRVYTFAKIPKELEKFMTFGFFQCLDAFLYIFTFLPLRFIMAFFNLSFRVCILPWLSRDSRLLEPAQICDLIKGVILVCCCVMMQYIDVSMMYHIIRGQAIIKLYIFFNMLEVADKLFSSFGQDILDSLFWTATEPRGRKREHIGLLPHLIIAILYVWLHAILVLFQATTINVAFNSHNKSLLTIMMSNNKVCHSIVGLLQVSTLNVAINSHNKALMTILVSDNFVELKGSVFKKFEKNNLFQMSCNDVRERFHFAVLLFIVCMRNMTEFSWNMDHLWVLIPDVAMVMISEVLVDWVKHAFITRFNEISFEVYHDYTKSIAIDMAHSRRKNAFSDLVEIVSRRMGFIPLPIAVLIVRVVSQSLRLSYKIDIVLFVFLYLCLLTFKVLNSIVLLGIACDYTNDVVLTTAHTETPTDIEKPKVELKRSKSVGDDLNLVDEPPLPPEVLTTQPMTPKPLFPNNSTVSLASISLNEDITEETQKEPTPQKLKLPEIKMRPPPKPLHEIDRYTMCSNRII